MDEGYRLTGRWEWATRNCHADWVIVQALVSGSVLGPGSRCCLSGMSRSMMSGPPPGCDPLAATPSTLRIASSLNIEGWIEPAGCRSSSSIPMTACLRVRSRPSCVSFAAAPALGAAEAAVDLFRDRIRGAGAGVQCRGSCGRAEATRIRLAAAIADSRAARAVVDNAIADLQRAVATPVGVSLADRAGSRLATADIVRRSRDVIVLISAGAGAGVYSDWWPPPAVAARTLKCSRVTSCSIGIGHANWPAGSSSASIPCLPTCSKPRWQPMVHEPA